MPVHVSHGLGGRAAVRYSIGAALIVLALGLVGAIAGPRIAQESALTDARAAHAASYENWREAAEILARAHTGWRAAHSEATTRYTQAKELAEAVPAEMLAPSEERDTLLGALTAYGAAAGLVVDSSGAVIADAATDGPPMSERQSVPRTADEFAERSRELDASSADLVRTAKAVWGRAHAAYVADAALSAAKMDFVAAAYASGTAWSVPEKASPESRDAYVRAATALNPESVSAEADALALVATYVSSRRAVQQSHDDAVAAETRAAAEAASRRVPGGSGSGPRPTWPWPYPTIDMKRIAPPTVVHSSSWTPGCLVGPVILVDPAGWGGVSDVGLSVPYSYHLSDGSVYYNACWTW